MNILEQMRKRSITEIEYIIIARDHGVWMRILPPNEFNNHVIDFIKSCPKDILQLKSGLGFYELCERTAHHNGYNVSVIYDKNLKNNLSMFTGSKRLRLFFIDAASPLLSTLIVALQSIHVNSHFYLIYNDKKNSTYDLNNTVSEPIDFFRSIIENHAMIFDGTLYNKTTLTPNVGIVYESLLNFHYFIPTRNNYFTTNAMFGNFATQPSHYEEINLENLLQEESETAVKNMHSWDRQSIFIEQLNKMDYLMNAGLTGKAFHLVNGTEAVYSPLFLIAPFSNPDLEKLIPPDARSDKRIQQIVSELDAEQSENYVGFSALGKKDKAAGMRSMKFSSYIVKYLDDVTFLHASNTFSPVVRLPLQGKSIYRELSFFRTSAFSRLNVLKNQLKLEKTMSKFSKIYVQKNISPKLQKQITGRNSQVVLVSDLPLEWLVFDSVPFAFSHDICRLPVNEYNSLMANFVLNTQFAFNIPLDITKKTLVITGSNEPSFQVWYHACRDLSKEKGFVAVHCDSIKNVEEAIKKHKPELLIFDCHGGYDETLHSTFLWIGKEKLTGEIIARKFITAPLVFLSACGTAPVYGTINTIANAFLGTGCLSVTATYLPVEINSSSILYIRLLSKLTTAAENGLHKNWLEFVSHVIRSSFLTYRFRQAIDKAGKDLENKLLDYSAEVIRSSLNFDKRAEIFKNIDNKIKVIGGIEAAIDTNYIPEYLFYTNIGRSDLIYFSSYLDKFQKKNKIDENEYVF